MGAMKAETSPSIVSLPHVKLLDDGDLDVPYYLYNFRRYQSSSNCPPGGTCNDCEEDGDRDCLLYSGWYAVGELVDDADRRTGTSDGRTARILRLAGPIKGCECSGVSDSKGRGSSCKVWSKEDRGLAWCYVAHDCSDPTIQREMAVQNPLTERWYPSLWVSLVGPRTYIYMRSKGGCTNLTSLLYG